MLGRFSRRDLGLGLAGTALGYWLCPRERTHELVRVQELRARGELRDASGPSRPKAVRLHALGDIGLATPERDLVVAELAACLWAEAAAAVLLLGDNFYPDGVSSVTDPQWRTKFEDLFSEPAFSLPFHACLGNHDHNGNAAAQVEYSSRSSRWRMPASYYTFTLPLDGGGYAQIFVLDTQRIWKSDGNREEQLAWLERELAASTAIWKIVAGHHPIRSGGLHGEGGIMAKIARGLEPIFARNDVALYVSGHDHDLQLLEGEAGWMQVVSGAGSLPRDSSRTAATHFVAAAPGFATLVLSPETLGVEFQVVGQGLVHSEVIRRVGDRAGVSPP